MATLSRSRRAAEARSGGKIIKARRFAASRTPYDRPRRRTSPAENPSWLAGLIVPATRRIATGAGRLISMVFGSDSSSSSSTSSSSESDSSFSEDNVADKSDINDASFQTEGWLNKKCFSNEPQSRADKSENKHIIEQLLMKESFSREECDKLIKIIKSRVIDSPIKKGGEDGGQEITDICNSAVMEAKKWIEEKKLGSSSKSKFFQGTCTNSTMFPHVAEGEVGSPVDMAKSYMQDRRPWASPSMNSELKTPSPAGVHLFKEETPCSISGSSWSTSKLKRDSLTSGSWNFREEIRRVRSKATEDLLKTLPSTKIDLSTFALKQRDHVDSMVGDKIESGVGNKLCYSSSLTAKKSTNGFLNLDRGTTTSHSFSDLEIVQGEANVVFPANFVSELNQVVEDCAASGCHSSGSLDIASQQHRGLQDGLEGMINSGQEHKSPEVTKTVLQSDACDVDGHTDNNEHNQQLGSTTGGALQDSRSNGGDSLPSKEAMELGNKATANGFSSLQSSSSEPKTGPSEEPPLPSSHYKMSADTRSESCHLLTEASIEVIANETDDAAGGPHNSFSMHHEELTQDPIRPRSKHSMLRKTGNMVEKQQEKKPGRPKKQGRGKGK